MSDSKETSIRWVSDLIGDSYKEWFGRKILLGCGTGRGKSTFALKIYCQWLLSQNKSVLYISNRLKLKEQITDLKRKFGVDKIELTTYQALQEKIRENKVIDYDVYICDESHYFLADAGFNFYTDLSYGFLLNQKKATVIYMTATYWNIRAKLKKDLAERGEELLEWFLPTDYSYVNKIYWYQKPSDLYGIVDRIYNNTEDKILYFCNSEKQMKKFYSHYNPSGSRDLTDEELLEQSKLQDMKFICSKYVKKGSWLERHCSQKSIRQIEGGGYTFDSRVLVATKVIDNGVDFKDKSIKHIIVDVFDLESALQCLGRKRSLNTEDTCTFYIRDWQHNHLRPFLKNVQDELIEPQLFLDNREEWEKQYGSKRDRTDKTIFYDFRINDFNINALRYEKLKEDEFLIRKMMFKDISYREKITSRIGAVAYNKVKDLKDIQADTVKSDLEIWLERNLNQKLLKDKQKELIDLCNIRDKWNRQQKSLGIISKYIEINFEPYILKSKIGRKEGKRYTYWILTCQKNEPD